MGWPIATLCYGLFVAWLIHSLWTIYSIYHPSACNPTKPGAVCLMPSWKETDRFQMFICTSVDDYPIGSKMNVIWKDDSFLLNEPRKILTDVKLPRTTLNNGSLYLHVVVTSLRSIHGVTHLDIIQSRHTSHAAVSITKHVPKQADIYNLLGSDTSSNVKAPKISRSKAITHWKPKLIVNIVSQTLPLSARGIPGELAHLLKLNQKKEYLPIAFISEVRHRVKDLWPVNSSYTTMPLEIEYEPISIGFLHFMLIVENSFGSMANLGFSEIDIDDVKSIFFDTNIFLLLVTVFVTSCHILFDFLAFKNDIQFWRNRKSVEGLSSSVIIWRCVSQSIITLYLFDQQTSFLVLIPAAISVVIEFWKIKKALKISIKGFKITMAKRTSAEQATDQYDAKFMKYMARYLLYPLVILGAIYSLFYTQHKSWYSWAIQSAANGVYAFGFLFMLPQLFINYKLKSVAHLPWRAFMYKAFNTFIDDLFAFILTSIPTAHRVAAFRDDIVFIIYLYQRWLYPVDKSRVDEGAEDEDSKKTN